MTGLSLGEPVFTWLSSFTPAMLIAHEILLTFDQWWRQDQGSPGRKLTAGSTHWLASRLLSLLSKSPHVDNHSSTTDRSPGKTQERRTGLWTPEMLMVLWEPRSSVGAQVYNKYSADRYWRQCHETGKHTTFYEIKSENRCVSVIYSCVQSTPTLVA